MDKATRFSGRRSDESLPIPPLTLSVSLSLRSHLLPHLYLACTALAPSMPTPSPPPKTPPPVPSCARARAPRASSSP
eukprot:6055838-Pleurochrysis_carterae.AAC.3